MTRRINRLKGGGFSSDLATVVVAPPGGDSSPDAVATLQGMEQYRDESSADPEAPA
jgi:hypothetical protein